MSGKMNFERARLRDLVRQTAHPSKPLVDRLKDPALRESLARVINATRGRSAKDYTFALSLQRQAIKTGKLTAKQIQCLRRLETRI